MFLVKRMISVLSRRDKSSALPHRTTLVGLHVAILMDIHQYFLKETTTKESCDCDVCTNVGFDACEGDVLMKGVSLRPVDGLQSADVECSVRLGVLGIIVEDR